MSKTKRNAPSYDEMVAVLSQHERSILDIGNVCADANDACEHGEWQSRLERLQARFDWFSEATAYNYMAIARACRKSVTVTDLVTSGRVPMRALYRLGKGYLDDPAFPSIVNALASATHDGKSLAVDEALAKIQTTHDRFHQRRKLDEVNPLYGNLLPTDTPAPLLAILKDVPEEVRNAITDKLHAMTGRAITVDNVTAAYGEVTGTKARVTIDESEPANPESVLVQAREAFARKPSAPSEPTLAPAMAVRPAVLHVAKGVKARQRKPRELSPEEKEQDRRHRIREEIGQLEDRESTDDLLARLRHLAAKQEYTRDLVLIDVGNNVEEFNILAPLYGWEPEPEEPCKVCGGTGELPASQAHTRCGIPFTKDDGSPQTIGPLPCPDCRPAAWKKDKRGNLELKESKASA